MLSVYQMIYEKQCILFGGAKTHVCVYEGRIVLMCMKNMWPGSLRVRTMEGGKA